MSHTNSTPNYELPQFITTDKPFWLTDINQAFSDIDTNIKNASDAATTAGNNAVQALSDASAAATTANGADAKASGAVASIADAFDTTATYAVGDLVVYNNLLYECSVAVITPGAWTGSANWTRKTIEDEIASELALINNALTEIHDIITPVSVSVTPSTKLTRQYIHARKEGKVCYVNGFVRSDSIAANEVVFTLNGITPVHEVGESIYIPVTVDSNNYHAPSYFALDSSGNVTVPGVPMSDNLLRFFNFSFPIE